MAARALRRGWLMLILVSTVGSTDRVSPTHVEADEGAPLWTDRQGRPTTDARHALRILRESSGDGLDPTSYSPDRLGRLEQTLESVQAPAPADVAAFEHTLSAAMLRYLRDIHVGRVDPRSIGFRLDVPPDQHDFSAELRRAVAEGRVVQLPQRWRPALRQYEELRTALAAYRSTGSSPPTTTPLATAKAARPGASSWRMRQIELALERLRWLPHFDDERLIGLNIPMFRLWAWDRGTPRAAPRLGMDVIVGRAIHTQTPVFLEDMRAVTIRPYWNVPQSILRHEIVPRLERDPDYLRREQMELVRGDGDDASIVEWSRDALRELRAGTLRVRQRPGPRNALGLIKFVVPNAENVYMHGTPAQELFTRSRRDFSHGCVRVADPIALGEWVLQDLPAWNRERLQAAMTGTRTIHIALPRPIHVVLFYTTAVLTPEDGALHFVDDIYGHDLKLHRALVAQAGRASSGNP